MKIVKNIKGVGDGQHIMIWRYNNLIWSAPIRKTGDNVLYYVEGRDKWEHFDGDCLNEDAEIVAYVVGG